MHTTLPATRARTNLYQLINETAHSHRPIHITSKKANAVLIAENDWMAILETLHLLSIPKMRQSIKKGLATSVKDCLKELDW